MSRARAGRARRCWSGRRIRPAAPTASPRPRRDCGQLIVANELMELTVAQAAERIRSGELSADEYLDAYREAAAEDSLNAFLWRAENGDQADLVGTRAAQEESNGKGELAGIPVA